MKIFLATIITVLTLTNCTYKSKVELNIADRKKLVDSLAQMYQEYGDTLARQHAEQFVKDFENTTKVYGDSVTYFNGISVGFTKPTADTAELRRINQNYGR